MAATDMATSAEMAEQQSARSGNDLVEGFSNLTLVRQVGLMLGLAASVALGFAVVLWSQETDYRPLYGSLDRLDAVEVANILETNQIEYKIEPSTGALLVPSDTIHTARLKLAEVGIGTQQAVGFELLDQEMPLGTSQFMENTRYHRGLEGELARTITSINSVRTARVHLAIPKRSVFVRDVRKPTSSVFLEVYPGRDVKPAQVKAIVNLVASSISELQPADVTVVDQRGNLLSTGEENAELVLADKQRRLVGEVEERLLQRVNTILEPVVGSGNFRAQINAQLDFTAIEQAQERYDGEEPQVRSEHTINEVRTDDGVVGGIPGALSNQPPLEAEAPQQIDPLTGNPVGPAPIKHSRENITRNYEMDRTISYTRRPQGEVSRLSVAVVLDNKRSLDAEGNAVTEPWTEAEIDTLTTLVRDAVGFLEERGDRVSVLNSPFLVDTSLMDAAQLEPAPWWQQAWAQSYLRPLVGLLVILALIFGLLRPVLKSIARSGSQAAEEEEMRQLAALEAAGLGGDMSADSVTLTGGAMRLPGPEESYEQQLNAIKGLVAEDPGRVAQVVKSWINKDQ